MENDTIAAIATALSESGIGIIRISGDKAFSLANTIFFNKKNEQKLYSFKSHTIHYGYIKDEDKVLDEVMISVMKAPNTFTREDVVEINCHGGILVLQNVLSLVLSKGARLATPGEFTKRAFLNGRIDLSKAEAVMNLIASKNSIAIHNSIKQLNGRLYDIIKNCRERIIYEIAYIESALDDPEHISLDGYSERLDGVLIELLEKTNRLIASAQKGKIVQNGIKTVIAGKPNVGKSSLLNILSGKDTAIVTEIEGTTRDIIKEQVMLGNACLNLIDTAGIRDTEDFVENIGVNRAKEFIQDADLVLFVIDMTREISQEDIDIVNIVKDKKVLLVWNKSDIKSIINKSDIEKLFGYVPEAVEVSAKEGTGIIDLEKKIQDMFMKEDIKGEEELYITNIRHENELKSAAFSLQLVRDSIRDYVTEDFYTIDLMNAYTAFGRIIGEDVDDDLIKEIFSKFCMGK